MNEMTGTPIAHAPGFIANETPRIVTARFDYEDSHTLERYEATDGSVSYTHLTLPTILRV